MSTSPWSKFGGMGLILLSSIFFSITFLLLKQLENTRVNPIGGSLLLNIGVLIPSIIVTVLNEHGPGWSKRKRVFQGLWAVEKRRIVGILCIQATLQGISILLRSYAIHYISIGDMTIIVFSSPILTTIIAHFMLKEKCGMVFIGAACFTLCGVVIIARPPIITGKQALDRKTIIGSCLALGALISLSLKFVVTRKIKEEHFLIMTLFLGSFGVLLSMPLFFIFEEIDTIIPQDLKGILLTIGLVSAFFAIATINLALKMESPGLVSLVRSCDVIFAFLLQYLFLSVIPDVYSIIGATIVWFGVVGATGNKWWIAKKENQAKVEESKNAGKYSITLLALGYKNSE